MNSTTTPTRPVRGTTTAVRERRSPWFASARRAVSGRGRRPVDAAITHELQIIVDRVQGDRDLAGRAR